MDYSVFRGVSLKKMRFERCSFAEADFSLADLDEAIFKDCDLSNVDLQQTTFAYTDLRGSNLTGWNPKRYDLTGIIVTPSQLEALAGEIGIHVVSPEGELR
jgi:fluoroquinolone resistance protein